MPTLSSIVESVTSSFTPILNSWTIANSDTSNYSNL